MHKNGSREVGKCPDTEPLDFAYTKLAAAKTLSKATQVASLEKPRKKRRKPNQEATEPALIAPITPPKDSSPKPSPTSPTISREPSMGYQTATAQAQDPAQQDPLLPSPKLESPSPPQVHFYLLLPSTPTSYRVLIPLASSDSLSTALRDRFVLEFPTIYALKQPPDRLPTGFMTEEGYLRNMAEKGHIDRHFDGLLNEARAEGQHDMDNGGKQDVDPGALQDVLKRDLISVVDAV